MEVKNQSESQGDLEGTGSCYGEGKGFWKDYLNQWFCSCVYWNNRLFAVLRRLSDTVNILYLAQCLAHGSAQLACVAVIVSIMTGDRELRRGQW